MSINVLGSPSDFEREAKRRLDREKSKRKTANYFLSGEDDACISVPDATMTEEQLQEVGEKLASGEISEESRKKLLRHVQGPMVLFGEKAVFNGNPDRGCEGIQGHDREKKILGKVMKVKPADLTPLDLAHFDKKYPTPLDFERRAEEFLTAVGRTASPEELAEYEKAMESFQRKVYGEKYEYYLAMKALMREAEERASVPPFAGDIPRRRATPEDIEGSGMPDAEFTPRVRPVGEDADGGGAPDTRHPLRVRPGAEGGSPRLRPDVSDSEDALVPGRRRPELPVADEDEDLDDAGAVGPYGTYRRRPTDEGGLGTLPEWPRRDGVPLATPARSRRIMDRVLRGIDEETDAPHEAPTMSFPRREMPAADAPHEAPTMSFHRREVPDSGGPDSVPRIMFPHEGVEAIHRTRASGESLAPRLVMPYEYVGRRVGSIVASEGAHEEGSEGDGTRRRVRRAEKFRVRPNVERELSPESGQEALRNSVIEGDELLVSNGDKLEPRKITQEDLAKAELAPTCEVEVEGVWIGFSDVFLVDGKREAAIGYVEHEGKVYVRSYYRSGKDAVWRYLPDRKQEGETGGVVWYGKGHGEESLTLPAELQAVLNRRAQKAEHKPEEEMSDDERRRSELRRRSFYGVAKSIDDPKTRMINPESCGDALSREVDTVPAFSFLDGVAPETLMPISDESWPDFGREVVTSEGESEIYGHFTMRTYESQNGEIRWTIIEDDRGQAWIGHVETKAPITSTGLRSSWIRAGGFEKSLYEVPTKAGRYGDMSDAIIGTDSKGEKRPRYVSMWKNYLSKLSVIKAYKARNAGRR